MRPKSRTITSDVPQQQEKFYFEYEKSNSYFFNLEKKRGKQKSWSKIKTESGNILTGIEHILREQVNFYETLFKSEGIYTIAAESLVSKLETSSSE